MSKEEESSKEDATSHCMKVSSAVFYGELKKKMRKLKFKKNFKFLFALHRHLVFYDHRCQ
jgi:hypothetical protein